MSGRPAVLFSAIVFFCAVAALGVTSRRDIRLPITDIHGIVVSYFIERDPDPDYSHASPEAYEDFLDMKFGIRIHWGIYSTQGMVDTSWPLLKLSYEERQGFQEAYKTWNPQGFDAEEWMDFFERSGVRVFAFTAKHHEGFSMYDTRTRVKRRVNWTAAGGPEIEECDLAYSIMETPFGSDVVKELTDAAHRRGIRIDLYYSHPDWYDADFRPYCYHPLSTPDEMLRPWKYGWIPHNKDNLRITLGPDVTEDEKHRMVKRHREQLIEILSNYGRIDMVCLDMWMGPEVWPEMRETIKMLRKIQPDVMFRARGIGNYGDYYTPERFVPGRPSNTDMPWMVIYPVARSFAYDPDASRYKGARWIIHNLIDATAKGGNFMAAIGPDADGRFHPEAVRQFEETGDWLRVNGEAIYATRMWDHWKEGESVRFTRTKDNKYVYAVCMEWPGDRFRSRVLRPREGSKVRMLGVEEDLEWSVKHGWLTVEIPRSIADNKPCGHAWALKVELP